MMRNENHRMHIFVAVAAEGDQASALNGLPLSSSVVVGDGVRCRLMLSWMVVLCVWLSDDVAVRMSRILL
jgi:hypothetical protein